MSKPVVMIVCTQNSARSQMAEGWLRHLAGDRFTVFSAGMTPGRVNPLAVEAMAEVGIDLSAHTSDGIEKYLGKVPVYYLMIVCDKAAQSCPAIWPGMRERIVWPFDDPAAVEGDHATKLASFRRVRDEIKAKLEAWLAEVAVGV